jgi:hypothetical protein
MQTLFADFQILIERFMTSLLVQISEPDIIFDIFKNRISLKPGQLCTPVGKCFLKPGKGGVRFIGPGIIPAYKIFRTVCGGCLAV